MDINKIDTVFKRLQDYFSGMEDVCSVIVFGSYADGAISRRSDLDIILIKKTEKRFLDRLQEHLDLDSKLGVACDLLVYTPEEWEKIKTNAFFRKMPTKIII